MNVHVAKQAPRAPQTDKPAYRPRLRPGLHIHGDDAVRALLYDLEPGMALQETELFAYSRGFGR